MVCKLKIMKILEKNILKCKNEDGTTNTVLEIFYTHKTKERQRILVKDYNDRFYRVILAQIRKKVTEYYNNQKAIWQSKPI